MVIRNYYFLKVGNIFQAQLHGFLLLVFVMMLFFLCVVLITMAYVVYRKGTVHYMGHIKSSIETIAFLLSGFTLFAMSFPSMYLLYIRGSQVQPNLTVKVVGSQ